MANVQPPDISGAPVLLTAGTTALTAANSGQPGSDLVPPGEPPDNQPFDLRIMRKPLGPYSKNVVSGVITTQTSQLLAGQTPVACYFMFNPTQIVSSYGFDGGVNARLPAQLINPAAVATQQASALSQTQSFNLLFDRTYEVWNGPAKLPPEAGNPLNGGPYRYGVRWDVWAIERLLGIYGQANGQLPSTAPLTSVVAVKIGGVVPPNTSTGGQNFKYGQTVQGEGAITNSAFSYISFEGFFTDFSVTYTRFDSNMTPVRCEMSLQFQQTYSNPSNPNTPAPTPPADTSGAGTTGTNPAPPPAAVPPGPNQFGGSSNNTPFNNALNPLK